MSSTKIQITYLPAREKPRPRAGAFIAGSVRLEPGRNEIDSALWDKVKERDSVKLRIEWGAIEVSSSSSDSPTPAPASKSKSK